MRTKIVCVFNKQEVFEKIVKDNVSTKTCEVFAYDNTNENVAITKRYNDFIEKNIAKNANIKDSDSNAGFWCVFIHQDFGIQEDIDLLLNNLNKNYIYGAIGIKFNYPILLSTDEGFDTSKIIIYGMIAQRINNDFISFGEYIKEPTTVDAIDCCCIIIHSSIIKKYNLRFDENLNFHMYAEELCFRAKKDYQIKTKVVQMKCFHLGMGVLNEEFRNSAKYLKNKFKVNKIPSTCPN